MKYLIILFSIIYTLNSFGQTYKDSIIEYRIIHTGELIDTALKILNQEELDHFEGLAFYEIDSNFRIIATFTKNIGKRFKMPTSTDREPIYRRYGFIDFEISGTSQRLTVYQNMGLRKMKEYKNYLFIPFRDATCGKESYGGGRYLDTEIPKSTKLIIDFNRVYNPYCVYSHRYSCPIPPEENTLTVPIKAGEKVPVGYDSEH